LDYLKECKDEEARLRASVEKRASWHVPEFLIALHCGLRPSEQFALTWDHVDFTRRQLCVPRSKNGRMRYVPLNSEVLAALTQIYERPIRKDRVFLSIDGKTIVGYRHWFNAAVKEAGLKDFTWYCLRHTFASRLVMAGVDIRTVAELMGHRTIQMTMRYAHLAPAHTLAAVEKLVTTTWTDTKTDTWPQQAARVDSKKQDEVIRVQ
jgi:integrase